MSDSSMAGPQLCVLATAARKANLDTNTCGTPFIAIGVELGAAAPRMRACVCVYITVFFERIFRERSPSALSKRGSRVQLTCRPPIGIRIMYKGSSRVLVVWG